MAARMPDDGLLPMLATEKVVTEAGGRNAYRAEGTIPYRGSGKSRYRGPGKSPYRTACRTPYRPQLFHAPKAYTHVSSLCSAARFLAEIRSYRTLCVLLRLPKKSFGPPCENAFPGAVLLPAPESLFYMLSTGLRHSFQQYLVYFSAADHHELWHSTSCSARGCGSHS